MKRVLVTGGAGYIGSHTVVELVSSGYSPIILDNFSNSDEKILTGLFQIIGKETPVYRIDCEEKDALLQLFQREKPQAVIHFAANKAVGESVQTPLKYYRNNLMSLISLLEVMNACHVNHLVFSSSCTVYGQPDHLPVTEQTPIKPASSPYGYTKQVCEQIIRDFCLSSPGFSAVLLRYFNPIGAHPSGKIGEMPLGIPNNLIPFLVQAVAGVRDQLVVYGDDYDTPDGSCIRDYIHVVDLAQAHVYALDGLEKKEAYCDVFNLGQGHGNSVFEVIREFEKATGKKVPYRIGTRRSGDVEQIWADVAKANQLLGWKTKLSLGDALRDAWRWQVHYDTLQVKS